MRREDKVLPKDIWLHSRLAMSELAHFTSCINHGTPPRARPNPPGSDLAVSDMDGVLQEGGCDI